MKIGVITFHRAVNFGAVLQTYALQRVLRAMGLDAEVIDYHCPFIEEHTKPISWHKVINIRWMLMALLRNDIWKDNRRIFHDFIKQHVQTSGVTYRSLSELNGIDRYYDMVVTGSDQVWNPNTAGFDHAFFLTFVSENQKKVAYAASFGLSRITSDYFSEYRHLLNEFYRLSVRERIGAQIIQDLTHRDACVVLDPSLLLSAEEWLHIATRKFRDRKYVVLYVMAKTESIIKYAIDKAHSLGAEVLYVNERIFNQKGVVNLGKLTPNEWVGLFYDAEYVVTNSFHGTAFAMNFEKQFMVEMLPESCGVNSRLECLLADFGLSDRVIGCIEGDKAIDYLPVRETLMIRRNESIAYIDSWR